MPRVPVKLDRFDLQVTYNYVRHNETIITIILIIFLKLLRKIVFVKPNGF